MAKFHESECLGLFSPTRTNRNHNRCFRRKREWWAVVCRGGGANGAPAPSIQGQGGIQRVKLQNGNAVTRW